MFVWLSFDVCSVLYYVIVTVCFVFIVTVFVMCMLFYFKEK